MTTNPTPLRAVQEQPYRPPRAPAGLQREGRGLWRDVVREYALRADELRVLAAACRLQDELSLIEATIAKVPAVMIKGSTGQLRVNPVLAEARNHRLALSKLLGSLDLPEAEGADSGRDRSARGRALARARWAR